MGRLKRRLIAVGAVVVLIAMSFLPTLFRGGSPPPPPPRGSGAPPSTGSVLTAGGGPAPSGTRVRALGGVTAAEVAVRPDGTFTFENLPEGTSSFEAVCGPLRAVAAGLAPVRLRLPGAVDVVGRVVVGNPGEPVAAATVRLGQREAVTDERGRFRLAGVPVPKGRPPAIRIAAPGFRELVHRPLPESSWDDLFLRLDRE